LSISSNKQVQRFAPENAAGKWSLSSQRSTIHSRSQKRFLAASINSPPSPVTPSSAFTPLYREAALRPSARGYVWRAAVRWNSGFLKTLSAKLEQHMELVLIVVLLVLLLGGGGWYGRGRWYGRRPL
jgi:hypothetical protein